MSSILVRTMNKLKIFYSLQKRGTPKKKCGPKKKWDTKKKISDPKKNRAGLFFCFRRYPFFRK